MVTDVDVVIIGGGMVGSLLAFALSEQQFRVAVVERGAKKTSLPERVSAINIASQQILKRLNVFDKIPPQTISPLQCLSVWDETGGGEIQFDSADVGLPELGSIIENQAIVAALQTDRVTIINAQPAKIQQHNDFVELEFTDQTSIKASLCVGADGAHSWLRETLKIPIKEYPYFQQAIIATVKTEKPHQQTGWQAFLPTGPLALLPLADKHHCSIVWSNHNARANELMTMDSVNFECELNNAFGTRLGYINEISERAAFPLMMRHAVKYTDARVALVGDAAHTIHPLAGQGANLGFLDATALLDCLVKARSERKDIASTKTLGHYQRWRKVHNSEMIAAMRLFHELFANAQPFKTQLRSHGLSLVNKIDSIKSHFIKIAVGKRADLPTLAKFLVI